MNILGRTSHLSTQVEETCRMVAALDPDAEAAAMIGQILRARPDIEQQMNAVFGSLDTETAPMERVLRALGAALVKQIKELPAQVDILVGRINEPSTEPALRCALVSVLAYVSQERDLVPDDAPGGYGFVDDCAMLTAALLHMLEPTAANVPRIEAYQQALASLQSMLPRHVNTDIQQAVQGLILLVESVRTLPEELADALVQQMLDSPEDVVPPQPAADFRMPDLTPPGAGHWSGGAYFEGNNVIIPGGPSLIDGELFIPNS